MCWVQLCNESNFRLTAEIGHKDNKVALKQNRVVAIYQRELRMKPDLRDAARWSWSMPLRLDQPLTTLKCQKLDDDRCTYLGFERLHMDQAPHWRISSLSESHPSMLVIMNETSMEVCVSSMNLPLANCQWMWQMLVCQFGFEEEWHKHHISAQGSGTYG